MTRETKIGLLVGLAFIIVIGILLSDHMTSSTDPPPAALVSTGRGVRSTIATPGGSQQPYSPIVTPTQVQPQHTVPTPRDLQSPTPPQAIVQVGGPSIQTQAAPPAGSIAFVGNGGQMQQPTGPVQDQQVAGADSPGNPLNQIAQRQGESLVTVTPGASQQSQQHSVPQMGFRDYVAQSGDTVSRMAAKFLGSRSKAAQDAIIRANPTLQQDPNRVIEGRTYRIPISTAAASIGTVASPAPALTPVHPVATVASAAEYFYTVKEGDSLWRIAQEQLGNPGAIDAIKELNKDQLKGGDTIQVDMKLRLPGRPLARAN
jgi:LysM repeat protein